MTKFLINLPLSRIWFINEKYRQPASNRTPELRQTDSPTQLWAAKGCNATYTLLVSSELGYMCHKFCVPIQKQDGRQRSSAILDFNNYIYYTYWEFLLFILKALILKGCFWKLGFMTYTTYMYVLGSPRGQDQLIFQFAFIDLIYKHVTY